MKTKKSPDIVVFMARGWFSKEARLDVRDDIDAVLSRWRQPAVTSSR